MPTPNSINDDFMAVGALDVSDKCDNYSAVKDEIYITGTLQFQIDFFVAYCYANTRKPDGRFV